MLRFGAALAALGIAVGAVAIVLLRLNGFDPFLDDVAVALDGSEREVTIPVGI